ncbi:MAG TPA: hypothetical protein VGQ11_02295 [Candidatus Acidoferrales bacterium]|nr:hypothetical protein [Candidatus Acidoferrales bacterium]
MDADDALRNGCEILNAVLQPQGYVFVEGLSGIGSGGKFASGEYVRNDRRLELHFRFSLGLVTYHIGNLTLTHEAYMHALLGSNGGNKYPRVSDDPLEAFRDLAYDLKNYCGDFLAGDGDEFARCVKKAHAREKLTPFERFANDTE